MFILCVCMCTCVNLQFLKYVIINKNSGSPPSGMRDLSRFWLSCLGSLVDLIRRLLNYLAFQSFDHECNVHVCACLKPEQ